MAMAMELIRFLGAGLVLIIPGVGLAEALGLGKARIDRLTHGSCLGISLAIYLASLASQFNLHLFYYAWLGVWAVALIGWLWRRHLQPATPIDHGVVNWLIVVLLLVGISRFAVALPHELPQGWDPTFHLILARKIQLAQHAISDWLPFDNIALNYPTGSHALIVVLSAISGLPLHTIFKDLIPLLGVLTTAQIFVFTRRAARQDWIALHAAIIYGLWANFGSIGYFNWGGLPNELAMLGLMTMLSLYVEDGPAIPRAGAMAISFAALILVHHHTMVTAGVIILMIALWDLARRGRAWKLLIIASVLATVLDAFFLAPYAGRLTTLGSTHVLRDGEARLDPAGFPGSFGLGVSIAAVIGLAMLWLLRRRRWLHPSVGVAAISLVVLFIATEWVYPRLFTPRGEARSTIFTPSRFLTDLNYFLPLIGAVAVWQVQLSVERWSGRGSGFGRAGVIMAAILVGANQLPLLGAEAMPMSAPPGFLAACAWIEKNTAPTTIVLNEDREKDYAYWTTYLSWRRTDHTPIPVSEPVAQAVPQINRVPLLISGRVPPDGPGMQILEIISGLTQTDAPIEWSDPAGTRIVRIWPDLTQ